MLVSIAAVNWETNGQQSFHTVTVSDDVIPSLMSFEKNNVHSANKAEFVNFQIFQTSIPKYLLKHQYLIETERERESLGERVYTCYQNSWKYIN